MKANVRFPTLEMLAAWMSIGCIALAACLLFAPTTALAAPYASCITNSSGTVSFYLNEGGGNVTVTYEDGTVNANFNGTTTGINLPAGRQMFALGAHTAYNIAVSKRGSGVISPIASIPYAAPRGVDVNKNPSSPYFGQVYLAEAGAGIYAHNSDLSQISPTVSTGGVAWGQSGTNTGVSPDRLAVASDDYVMVTDSSTNGTAVWRLDPTLTASQLFLGPVGETGGLADGSHGVILSRPLLTGTVAGGDATLYTVDGDLHPYNSLQIYHINSGPLPWTNIPITGPVIGLVISNAENLKGDEHPGLTQGPNGYIYASTFRENYSNPDVQIYDATGTNQLWNSYYNGTNADYFVNAAPGGFKVGILDSAVSPDGKYLAAIHLDNHITLASLTNGIPDISTLRIIAGTANPEDGRGIAWDAADNFYVSSSGEHILQSWTLGQSSSTITHNDVTGTNGTFQFQPGIVAGIVLIPGITVAGSTNKIYSIQYVTNVTSTNWVTLVSNIVLQGASYLYPDTNAVGQPPRFYRVVAQ